MSFLVFGNIVEILNILDGYASLKSKKSPKLKETIYKKIYKKTKFCLNKKDNNVMI